MELVEIVAKLAVLDGQDREEFLTKIKEEEPDRFEDLIEFMRSNSGIDITSLIDNSFADVVHDSGEHLDSLEGTCIGPYRLTRFISQGGMGIVYEAERQDIEQVVAIKIVQPRIAQLMGKEKLIYEAKALARLNHPNIATIYDFGEFKETFYLATEFIDGADLGTYVNNTKPTKLKLCELFKDICNAIAHVHQNRIIHADIKPSNILVNADGVIKIIDFGIAVEDFTADVQQHNELKSLYLKGISKHYAAPEQLNGQFVNTLSDIYSIGKTLEACESFKCLDLSLLIGKCCANDPEERYQSSTSVTQELSRILNQKPVTVNKSPAHRFKLFLHRSKLQVALSLVFMLIFSAFLGSLLSERSKALQAEASAVAVADYIDKLVGLDNLSLQNDPDVPLRTVLKENMQHLESELASSTEIYPRIVNKIAFIFSRLDDKDFAESLLNRVIINGNDSELDGEVLAESYFALAAILKDKSIEEAVVVSKKAIALAPNRFALARYNSLLGSIYSQQQLMPDSISAYEDALNSLNSLQTFDDDIDERFYWYNRKLAESGLASAYARMAVPDDNEEAREKARQLIRDGLLNMELLTPFQKLNILSEYSHAIYSLPGEENKKQALRYMDMQIDLTKNHFPDMKESMARLYSNKGSVLFYLKEYEEVIIWKNKSLDILNEIVEPPHIGYAMNNITIGRAYLEMGLYDKAIQHLSYGKEQQLHFVDESNYQIKKLEQDIARAEELKR